MSTNKKLINQGRRQVLRGAGGFALALPFLPSLATRRAYGADPVPPKRFLCLTSSQGNVLGPSMFPSDTTLRATVNAGPSHVVRQGTLRPSPTSAVTAEFSPVLRAHPTVLSSYLAAKMNVLRGLDVPIYLGHSQGAHLGNYDGNEGRGPTAGLKSFPTIDQLMAWSPSVYPTGAPQMRSLCIKPYLSYVQSVSFGHTNPSNPSDAGSIVEVAPQTNPAVIFDRIFGVAGSAGRPSVVDRVLQNYNSLRRRNSRLSVGDRSRLESHMTYLAELQNRIHAADSQDKLAAAGVPSASCPVARVRPTSDEWSDVVDPLERAKLCFEIVKLAFSCDATRVATVALNDLTLIPGFSGSIHTAAHEDEQGILVSNNQALFEKVFLDVVRKFDDVAEAGGRSLLDNSLIVWSHEAGQTSHDHHSAPVITAGSAGGYLKTGSYCDYRNISDSKKWSFDIGGSGKPGAFGPRTEYTGLTHRRWLATILQAMGVPPAEFEKGGARGYGTTFVDANQSAFYDLSKDSDLLPFLKA